MQNKKPTLTGRPLLTGVVAAIMLMTTGRLAAQPMMPPTSLGEAFRTEYMRRDLETFTEILQLTDDQQVVLETIFEDYEDAVRDGSKALQEQLAEFRPPPPDEETRAERRRISEQIRELALKMRQASREAATVDERRAVMEEYRDEIHKLQEQQRALTPRSVDQNDESRQAMQRATEAWNAQKAVLTSEFEANVKAILDEQQQMRWPKLERTLRREKTIGRGELAGEAVDLLAIVETLDLPEQPRQTLAPVLGEYEIQLDAVLKARNDNDDAIRTELYEKMRSDDAQDLTPLVDRMIALHRRVRDVNDAYVQTIAAALTGALPEQPEIAAEFKAEAHLKGYPRIYRPTRAQRVFEGAETLEDLPDETRTEVETLEQAYLAELEPHNAALLEATRRHDPERMRQRYERMNRAPMEPGDDNVGLAREEPRRPSVDPINDAYRARRDLDQQYIDRLKALLGEELFSKLPTTRRGAGLRDRGQRSGRDWIKEFDANGNGRLDPEEHDALREYLRNRYRRQQE